MNPFEDMPNYDEQAVTPMREELTRVGFTELKTEADVDSFLADSAGSALIMINSVCGCAGGSARPGVSTALQNDKIPGKLGTVFAGQEKAAVRRVRESLGTVPPSSPFFALFKGGQVVHTMERHEISEHGSEEIARSLANVFNEHCESPGPSVPPEIFATFTNIKVCGSSIPRTEHAPDAGHKPQC